MARARFERDLPSMFIGTIGHIEHGKTTLISAISMALATVKESRQTGGYQIEQEKRPWIRNITTNKTYVEYETANRRYYHVDFPEHSDYLKALIIGKVRIDAAIVVISAIDGVMRQTQEQLRLAHQLGIKHIVVFINKKDLVDDELLELAKLEAREFLSNYGFPKSEVPIVAGSAWLALQAMTNNPSWQRGENKWVDDIYELIDAVDAYIPNPLPKIEQPFLMGVGYGDRAVWELNGLTVVTGRVERGRIKPNDTVEIVGIKPTRTSTVNGIERWAKCCDEDRPFLFLDGIGKDEIEPGMAIAFPGSITAHTQFDAQVYILKEETKDKSYKYKDKALYSGDTFEFYLPFTRVIGTIISLTTDDGSVIQGGVLPGERIIMSIQLEIPIAIEPGMYFSIFPIEPGTYFSIWKYKSLTGAGVVIKTMA